MPRLPCTRETILARIDELLEEAYVLPRSEASWERRLYIDWELFQLFRRLAAVVSGQTLQPDEVIPLESLDEHARRPRRHDHLSLFF